MKSAEGYFKKMNKKGWKIMFFVHPNESNKKGGRIMDYEMNFEYEFSTLEKAMEYAGTNEEKAIITKDYNMFYVVDCPSVDEYVKLGYDHV